MDRRLRFAAFVAAMFLVAACTANPSTVSTAGPPGSIAAIPSATPTATSTPEPTPAPIPTENLTEAIDLANFSASSTVTSEWFPLTPGTRWTWEGSARIDGKRVPRKVVFTVTDLTKVISGVRAVVGYDLDYTGGVLEEAEIALWAQDDDGFVWHLGQYPEVYEDGEIAETPAWIHGIEDAKAGISMKAKPHPFAPSYSQGWGPAVGWTDRARVFEMGSKTCVPLGCYDDVLVIDEFNRDEPDAHQLKYYVRGVGNVRVGWAGANEEEQEVLELTKFEHLGPEALAKVRETVLAQDARGYKTSPKVYGLTPPAESSTPAS
jgi:hypothetical protein